MALAPTGQLIYGSALIAAKCDWLVGAFSTLADTGAMMGAAIDTLELAKALGARIVDLRLVVDFVQIGSSDKGFLSRLSSTASVDGEVQPALLAGSSMMSVQRATMRTTVMLPNPLLFSPAAINGQRESTSTAIQAGNMAAALINPAARRVSRSNRVRRRWRTPMRRPTTCPAARPTAAASGWASGRSSTSTGWPPRWATTPAGRPT